MNRKFAVVGGDLRSVKLANLFEAQGNIVDIYGFENAGFETGIEESANIEEAIRDADVVIGPLPCSNDDETLNAPFQKGRNYINDVFKKISTKQM